MDYAKLGKVFVFLGILLGLIGHKLDRKDLAQEPSWTRKDFLNRQTTLKESKIDLESDVKKSDEYLEDPVEEKKVEKKVEILERKDDIMRVRWLDPDYPIRDFVRQYDEPILIENAPQNHVWKAFKKWDWEYLGEQLEMANKVYRHSSRVFGPYWNSEKPMAYLDEIRHRNLHKEVNISGTELFENIQSGKDNQYFYFTTNINNIGSLVQDLTPLELIDLDPKAELQNINAWFGQKGVVAALHYDDYGNLNTQIKGKKKWTLYSPADHHRLFLFPFLHPHQAQSQVNIEKISPRYANALNAESMTVIVNEGETLYLPPLWLHQVEALEASININSWTFYPQSITMEEISKIIPFSKSLDPKSRTHHLQYFLEQIYNNLALGKSWVWINLINPRFEPLIEEEIFFDEDYYMDFVDPEFKINPQDQNRLTEEAKKASDLFLEIPESTRSIWLGNYIEFLSFYTSMGNTAVIPAMLKSISRIEAREPENQEIPE